MSNERNAQNRIFDILPEAHENRGPEVRGHESEPAGSYYRFESAQFQNRARSPVEPIFEPIFEPSLDPSLVPPGESLASGPGEQEISQALKALKSSALQPEKPQNHARQPTLTLSAEPAEPLEQGWQTAPSTDDIQTANISPQRQSQPVHHAEILKPEPVAEKPGLTARRGQNFSPPAAQVQPKANKAHDDEKKHHLLEAYFGRRPLSVYLLILAGTALVFHPGRYDPVYGFELSLDGTLIAGVTLIVLALYWRLFLLSFPTDQQVDMWTHEALKNLELSALEQMKIDDGDLLFDPLVFASFPDLDKLGGSFRASHYGKDHVMRYTPRALTILAFRKDDIVTYEGALDLTTGACVYEKVSEFFYSDITAVGMSRQIVRKDSRAWLRSFSRLKPWCWAFTDKMTQLFSGARSSRKVSDNSRDLFLMSLKNGDKIISVMRDGRMSGDRDYDELPLSMEKEVVPVIRDLVRQKKKQHLSHDYRPTRALPFRA